MATSNEGEVASPSVFISYRRGASSDITGRIHDWLERDLGPGRVLRDVDSIPVGVKFWQYLEQQLSTCDLMLAVIGPGWLEELGRDDDFVAQELGFALRRGIPVVPVLVGGVEMPEKAQLPEPLRGVAAFQAMTIDSGHEFRRKVVDLAAALRSLHARELAERVAAPAKAPDVESAPRRLLIPVLAVGALVVATVTLVRTVGQRGSDQARIEQVEAQRKQVEAELETMRRDFVAHGDVMVKLREALHQVSDVSERTRLERALQQAEAEREKLRREATQTRAKVGIQKPCACPPGDPFCKCL